MGRAIFHIDQRRGFKSNRKSESEDNEDEAQKTRSDISRLRERMGESGARTLGEYLAKRRGKGKSVRARPGEGLYPDRAMYEEEFDKIRAAQEARHGLSAEQWDRLREIIFFQRPLKPVDPGWCLFEEGEQRAAKALPLFQEFRMLQEVNNLKIQVGTEDRALCPDERGRALDRLRKGNNINLNVDKPLAALKLPSGAKFNLRRAGARGSQATRQLPGSPLSPRRPRITDRPLPDCSVKSGWNFLLRSAMR